MATAYVQSKSGVTNSATTIALALGAAVSSGNTLGTVYTTQAASFTSVSDNGSPGSTYTPVDTQTPQFGLAGSHYAKNVTGAPTSITFTFGSAIASMAVVHEVSGADTTAPLDAHAYGDQSAPGTGTDGCTSGTGTTTANGAYIMGVCVDYLAGSSTITAGTGFNSRETSGAPSGSLPNYVSEDLIQSSAGSIAATATEGSNVHVVTFMMAFKAAATGPTVDQYVPPVMGATGQMYSPMIGRRYV